MEYGLIGSRLGHSYSKIIHEKIASYSYELHPLPTEDEARAFLQERAFKAINVTIPYKQLVIPYCDEVDERAEAIGAVNTVVNRGGKLYGYNTDFDGFLYMLQAHDVNLAGRTVLVLGTGGTHNTVCAVARYCGAGQILTVSRSGGKDCLTYEQAAARRDVQVVINTTPAGMYPRVGECLLNLDGFDELEAVFDVVYNPFRTELLLRAEEKGVKAICGFEMLVGQAVYAAEHFMGQGLDHGLIASVHHELKRSLCNVSFIGMPASGKTTVGRQVAKLLGKEFLDLDVELEKRAGKTIPEIFRLEGEEGFRAREAALVAEYGKESSRVLSCGGGVIKTPGNAHALRQNGPVIWLRRPLEKLSVGGHRPLSSSTEALRLMQQERWPLYEAAADGAVDNTGRREEAVKKAAALAEELL